MKKHLSFYGSGPIYVAVIALLTLAAMILNHSGKLPVWVIQPLRIIQPLLGLVLIVGGFMLWYHGAIKSNITENIRENHLVTDGAYACVRNPIYSAFMLVMWGLLVSEGNLLLLLLCPLYWLLLTVSVKYTEEKWLKELYGQAYEDYCKKVNRCIPWFPKK